MSKHPIIHESAAMQSLDRFLVYLRNRHFYTPEERKRIDFSFEHDDFD